MKRTQSKAVKPARKGAVKAQLRDESDDLFAPLRLVYVLAADPESYDAMVEQMAKATWNHEIMKVDTWNEIGEADKENWRKFIQAGLASIGMRRNPRAARATTKGAE